MAVSLVACGGGGGDDEGGGGEVDSARNLTGAEYTGKGYPNQNEDGTPNLDKIAHYDPNYDYTQNEKFKICYMAWNADILYQQSADAVEMWAPKFNLEWAGFASANNDSEMFMTNLTAYLDQGVQMFIMDPDITVFPAIVDLISNYDGVVWMSQMGTARDYQATDELPDGEMFAPFVGFDYEGAGYLCGQKLVEWLNETYPDADISEVGFMSCTLTTSPPLHQRALGAERAFMEVEGVTESQYYEVDLTAYGLTMQGAIDGLTPVLTTNTQYKYWLIFGLIDDLAMGAATVIEQMGMTDVSCINCIGGPGLQTQLDAGQQTAFRYAYATPNLCYAEPIIGALYSFMTGMATPDTLWPSWVKANDHGGEGHSYANLLLPAWWISAENYQEFYAWADLYAGVEYYNYDVEVSRDAYSPFIDPPEGYTE